MNYTHYTCIDILGQNFKLQHLNQCCFLYRYKVMAYRWLSRIHRCINMSSKLFTVKCDHVCSVHHSGVHEDDVRTCRPRFIPTADNDSKWWIHYLSFFFLGLGFLLFIFPITILERSSVEWFRRLKLAATDFSSFLVVIPLQNN